MLSKKILITGGAGFIGSNLSRRLIKEEDCQVTILDNFSEQIHGPDFKKTKEFIWFSQNCRVVQADIQDQNELERIIPGHDVIVHLAAETGTGQSMYQISRYVEVNELGTATLLDAILNSSSAIEKLILASSRSIYGEGKYECKEHGIVYPKQRDVQSMEQNDFSVKCPFCKQPVIALPTDEDSEIHPQSIYGITKQNQEQLLFTFSNSQKIPAIALRFQNVYGPGQSLSNPYTGIISIFSNQLLSGKKVNVFEDGKESRDFVFIDDAINAIILAIKKKVKNADKNIYNIGSGKRYTVFEIAQKLKEIFEADVEIEISGMFRKGDIRHAIADIENVKNSLGYSPTTDLNMGLKKYSEWVQQQNIFESNYERSLQEMKEYQILK